MAIRDPFALKQYPKWHPKRAFYTLWARRQEQIARRRFRETTIPTSQLAELPAAPDVEWQNTEVQPDQMRHLLAAIQVTESMTGCCAVEIGAFRGETTAALAATTHRQYYVVDPYIGYGGCDTDLEQLRLKIMDLPNVVHLRKTSGQAALEWPNRPISFVFIDAVHDYVNVRFDFAAWSQFVVSHGLIAFHDTDNVEFAGVRRAVYDVLPQWQLFAHIDGLVILRKP